jgi:hypothetical protein
MKLATAFLLMAPAAAFAPGASISRSTALPMSSTETETKVRQRDLCVSMMIMRFHATDLSYAKGASWDVESAFPRLGRE